MFSELQIHSNQAFFEKCAQDYRILATILIEKLSEHLNLKVDKFDPLSSFSFLKMKSQKNSSNFFGDWKFFLHGNHIAFEHRTSGQKIEVDLSIPGEFGALDPQFYTQYIRTSVEYKPLPFSFESDYHDGCRIFEIMLKSGKFELISIDQNKKYVIVKNRNKLLLNWLSTDNEK